MENVNICIGKIKDAIKELFINSASEMEGFGNLLILTGSFEGILSEAFEEAKKESRWDNEKDS